MEEPITNKFKAGDTVYAKVDPKVPLVIRRFYKEIYYCAFADWPQKKELALFEREILEKKEN
ncbi:hypothetical protein [Algoriphagus mannitolivorans]|uniref:hypothetical protein n=1 Tax=Algoriphagus mannitolivorans TaxID=226504 RepID=UPI000423F351|nr:hypothetical protein [Algoriphagus mannitolivorans]